MAPLKKKLVTLWKRASHSTVWPHVASWILISFVFLGLYWREGVRAAFCSADLNEHCFREWISALGSFGTLVAIAFVIKQIGQASRHQSENIEIQLMGRKALALRVRAFAKQSLAGTAFTQTLDTAKNVYSSLDRYADQNELASMRMDAQLLVGRLKEEAWADFDREISGSGASKLRENCLHQLLTCLKHAEEWERLRPDRTKGSDRGWQARLCAMHFVHGIHYAELFFQEKEMEADMFLHRWFLRYPGSG